MATPTSRNVATLPRGQEHRQHHDHHPGVGAAEDAAVGAVPRGQPPEEQRAAERHELDQQDRGDQDAVCRTRAAWRRTSRRRRSRSGCRRCRTGRRPGRSASSGSCRISRSVVNSWPKLRLEQAAGLGDDARSPGRSRAAGRTGMIVNPAHHSAAESSESRTAISLSRPKVSWPQHHHQVERQQQAAAEVAQRPAARGDPVALVLGGDVDQDRVVADQRAAAQDAAEHDRDRAELPLVALA